MTVLLAVICVVFVIFDCTSYSSTNKIQQRHLLQSYTTINGTWIDDYTGWDVVDANNEQSNIVNQYAAWYHGPFSGNSDIGSKQHYVLTQQFYCIDLSSVRVSYYVTFCGTQSDDKAILYLSEQVVANTSLDDGTSTAYTDSNLQHATSCYTWKYYYLGAYNITSVASNELFKVQFEIIVNYENNFVALRDITIECVPIYSPTQSPTKRPKQHTKAPTNRPTLVPTNLPTYNPSNNPTYNPSQYPTNIPSNYPTNVPSISPTNYPTTPSPTKSPTNIPSNIPTHNPTSDPTKQPTYNPTHNPSKYPTYYPTDNPTHSPTIEPTTRTTKTVPRSNASNTGIMNGDTLYYIIIAIGAVFGCIVIVIAFVIYEKRNKIVHNNDDIANHYVQLMDTDDAVFDAYAQSEKNSDSNSDTIESDNDIINANDSDDDVLAGMITPQ